MSLLQVSFAAFAQRLVCPPPPASANGSVLSLAAPAEPGVGVDTLLPFHGVFQPRPGLTYSIAAGGFDGEWWLDWQAGECLDAPVWLPSGSHVPLVFAAGEPCAWVKADGYSALGRRWLS